MNIHSDKIITTKDMVSNRSQVLHYDRNLSSRTILVVIEVDAVTYHITTVYVS